MAETAGSGNSLAFLTQKAGPLPVWAWLAAFGGLWWYFQKKQTTAAGANQQTDPAGNVGSIDPSTGYVYGTPEDQAAQAANNAGAGGGNGGQNATTGAQTYADNNTWGIAAVNWLVAKGIDGTVANQAIQNYLTSQPLTTAEQGDVNLVIQALGAPPSLPGPISANPPVNTGGGTTTAGSQPPANPPAGDVWVISVPDGAGGWRNAVFPTGQDVTNFYNSLGVTKNNGIYPNGLTATQISNALRAAGGSWQ